ncbi:hypothetical protein, variant [Puccinia striiformis f. sp. tritici PST-78]|uniref:CCR4-NOT transcription complex subunit 1 domain-containing protein n=1 Tax=Puccinia striiformis f. sp. tritici PST-78 TaxID=1165861 RepID=A0A0L0UPQ3_9BASI|nr:hypothetical protein, variant [Puccinia striiformis f. sp. tritici PST-78]
MSSQIKPEHYNWFAKYLVNHRVSIEPNNHSLYLQFLDKLALPHMYKKINNETLIKCGLMLNSEQTLKSGSDRTILKNLASWLGSLTLAKNLPIKHHNIVFKDLLIQGFRSNRLIIAIPFVCKVLEQSNKSKVFKPPNPWLMGILKLLIKLYHYGELKLNLKFEIEVLCKALEIELKDVKPTEVLKKQDELSQQRQEVEEVKAAARSLAAAQHQQADQQHNHLSIENVIGRATGTLNSNSAPSAGATIPAPQPLENPGPNNLSGGSHSLSLNGQAGYASSLQDLLKQALLELPLLMTFSTEVVLNNNILWKRVVFTSIERAIRDIIGPVVERSVTIANILTREMILKDFAMEGEEDQMRTSAHMMVKNLAGSLALVTTKEPLRNQILVNIRTLSIQNGIPEHNVSDEEIQQVTADNLDVACQVIEKVATDKAILEIDNSLASAYEARRRHREHTNSAFWDTSAMAASHYSGMLPNPLKLKLGGLEPDQLRIYEETANVRNDNTTIMAITTVTTATTAPAITEGPVSGLDVNRSPALAESTPDLILGSSENGNCPVNSISEALAWINVVTGGGDREISSDDYGQNLAEIVENHEIRNLINGILKMLRQANPTLKDQSDALDEDGDVTIDVGEPDSNTSDGDHEDEDNEDEDDDPDDGDDVNVDDHHEDKDVTDFDMGMVDRGVRNAIVRPQSLDNPSDLDEEAQNLMNFLNSGAPDLGLPEGDDQLINAGGGRGEIEDHMDDEDGGSAGDQGHVVDDGFEGGSLDSGDEVVIETGIGDNRTEAAPWSWNGVLPFQPRAKIQAAPVDLGGHPTLLHQGTDNVFGRPRTVDLPAAELVLLASRCLANLMEALPGSAHTVVHHGAVPVLCANLLEINFSDLAEQSLSTLEKISEELLSSIVCEGGLTALLQYLVCLSTYVQRTAVTAAANCCSSILSESFDMVRDVFPDLVQYSPVL